MCVFGWVCDFRLVQTDISSLRLSVLLSIFCQDRTERLLVPMSGPLVLASFLCTFSYCNTTVLAHFGAVRTSVEIITNNE